MNSTNGKGLLKGKVNLALSILLAVTVLIIAVLKGPELWKNLQKVSLSWAFAGLGCYFVNYLFRATRFRTISEKRLKMWPDSVHSASLHGFATYLLPFRTGDLTLPVILNAVSGTGFLEGSRILIKARLLDISTLGCLMFFAGLFFPIPISFSMKIVWVLLGIGMSLAPIAVRWLEGFKRIRSSRMFNYFNTFGPVSSITLEEVLVSFGIWIAVGACFYCAAMAVGLSLSVGGVWLLISIQLPLQLIPIQGFANAGNHEGGWLAGLAMLGIPVSEALNFSLTSHALLIFYVLALGPVALLSRK
jgi:uncharacterized membrane protein YbhN (UPF0104 family)